MSKCLHTPCDDGTLPKSETEINTKSWMARNLINQFLKVDGITNEQARQCALIYNQMWYESQLEESGDDIRPFTENELIAKVFYDKMKEYLLNYIF